MKKIFRCEIKYNRRIGDGIFLLGVDAGRGMKVNPGEFFMVRVNEGLKPLLNRPFSWFRYYGRSGVLEFAYQVVGVGTGILSRRKSGEYIQMIGPLGKGFRLKGISGDILLVAGGMGIAGLWSVLDFFSKKPGCSVELVWGAKTKGRFFLLKDIPRGVKIHLGTEDGSLGHSGLATEIVEGLIKRGKVPTHIFACGPKAMLFRVAEIARMMDISGEVLYEEMMGCGFGACLGCSVPRRGGGYIQACVDGPALGFDEIDWERVRW